MSICVRNVTDAVILKFTASSEHHARSGFYGKWVFYKVKENSMPIYEYQCEKCNHFFEKLIFLDDDEKINCTSCGDNNVKKLLSAGSFMSSAGIGTCAANAPKGFS